MEALVSVLFRLAKVWFAIGLMLALWGLSRVRDSNSQSWVRPVGTRPGPVRITRFYASVGTLTAGQTAQLCYGVENARVVRIAPMIPDIYPSSNHCVEVGPEHTTHYTLLAEGYDGRVETRSFTLSVLSIPAAPQQVHYAGLTEHHQAQPQPEKLRKRGGEGTHAEEL
jgi:hypothetical protein